MKQYRLLRLLVIGALAHPEPAITQAAIQGDWATGTSRSTAPVTLGVAAPPLLMLGGLHDDPRYEFDAHSGHVTAALLPDEHVAVGDVATVKIFDRAGRLLRIIGRQGSGPGEFRHILAVCPVGRNHIVVVDEQLRKASEFRLDGTLVRERRLGGMPVGTSCFDNGDVVTETPAVRGPHIIRPRTAYLRVSLDPDVPNVNLGTHTAGQSGILTQARPTPGGTHWVVPEDSAPVIRVYNGLQAAPSTWRTAVSVTRVVAADVEAEVRSVVLGDQQSQLRERLRRKAMAAGSWPPFERLLVDARQRVWTSGRRSAGWIRRWEVFAMDGTPLATFNEQWPSDAWSGRVLAFGADRVLSIYTDHEGTTRIMVQRLQVRP